jgi:diguanylate cyclase (GGDEF)-like protein
VIGVIAIAGLALISNSVIRTSLTHWAAQWTDELDELGAPFYLSNTSDAVLGIERFVAKYPEIERVTWYRPDGGAIMALDQVGLKSAVTGELGPAVVAELTARAGEEPHFLLTEDVEPGRRFRLSGPVWTESIEGDDLLGFDPTDAETAIDLLGFVSVELDFSSYRTAFAPRLALASLVLFALLAASWVAGRVFLKRALSPLSALQQPLVELADGQRGTELPRSEHREIQTIVTVLDDTIAALDKREQHLLHLATHDPLTGLHNRHHFIEALEAEVAACGDKSYSSALLFIDLDQFKYVNDTSGHVAGDEMLKAAAKQIRHAVRGDDLVARFGGDEFVALIRDVTRSEAKAVATQVLELMRGLTHVAEAQTFHMQCSIGVAIMGGTRFNAQELLAQADIACRTAKGHGRNRVELYNISSKQSEQIERDVHWMREIRRALETDAFELHYQPLLHIPTRQISHYEALLRLRGEQGLIGPDRFLPAAVRFGLMTDIDLWVLERAVQALAELGADAPDLRLSVNLASFTFEGNNLVSRVRALLRSHGVEGTRLVFEITEQLAVRFASSTDKQFTALRDLGVRFAIDDFGTGYSSFSYLKKMPVDYLKIDGSFIRNLARDRVDQAMVRMVSEVASAARIETVAEYVQTAAVFELLIEYGIDYAPGRFVGGAAALPERAVPAALQRGAAT